MKDNIEEFTKSFIETQKSVNRMLGYDVKLSNPRIAVNNKMVYLKHTMQKMGLDCKKNRVLYNIIKNRMSILSNNALDSLKQSMLECTNEMKEELDKQESKNMLVKNPNKIVPKIMRVLSKIFGRKDNGQLKLEENKRKIQEKFSEDIKKYEELISKVDDFEIERDIVPAILEIIKSGYYGEKGIDEIKKELKSLGLEHLVPTLEEELSKMEIEDKSWGKIVESGEMTNDEVISYCLYNSIELNIDDVHKMEDLLILGGLKELVDQYKEKIKNLCITKVRLTGKIDKELVEELEIEEEISKIQALRESSKEETKDSEQEAKEYVESLSEEELDEEFRKIMNECENEEQKQENEDGERA